MSQKYKSSIKIPDFRQKTSKNTKKFEKEKNIFVHTTKCFKAKKSYYVFHTSKNKVLACILVLIISLLKSREHWPKFQKQQKIYCFVLVSEIMNLYVKCIPDIKKVFSFNYLEQLGFLPNKDLVTEKDFS